jgi:signal transduction histidine kinase
MLLHIPPNFLVHYSLILTFAKLVEIKLPLKKLIYLQFIAAGLTILFDIFALRDELISVPVVIAHASLYFVATTKAFKFRWKNMTLSQRIITLVLLIYGLHILSYSYVSTNPELLALGFGIALIIHMAISILFPAGIIELLSLENAKLKAEVHYRAKLTHAAKMAALGEMAGGMAHEINNPLMTISLAINLIKRHFQKNNMDKIPDLVDKTITTVSRIEKIVRGLLAFTRQSTSHYENIYVKELIEDTIILCTERLKNYDINLVISISESEIYIWGDKPQLTQVLLNLINNSFDAIKNLSERWIKIEVFNEVTNVVFSVTDSGRIEDKSLTEKMFEPFYTTKEIGSAIGLGLSVSKGIIESHNGDIQIDASGYTKVLFNIPKKNVGRQE